MGSGQHNNKHSIVGKGKPFLPGHDPRRNTSGAIKTHTVSKMIKIMGRQLAPEDIRDNAVVKSFLTENNLQGTNLECLVARLYALALYNGDMKAVKLLIEMLTGEGSGRKHQLIINFIAPEKEKIEEADLTSDSWTTAADISDAELSEPEV